MTGRELDAAGITNPALRASYEAARRLNAAHGRTYYLATRLLPPARRPAVHALYGFARAADEVVDDPETGLTDTAKVAALDAWARQSLQLPGTAESPVGPALRDTLARYAIPRQHIADFLASMRMDLTVTGYATHAELAAYTHGSAAVIGLQMLPVLGHPGVPYDVVAPYAAELGNAFQLTNFVRDVGEDLRRGRVYLPQDSLDAFGVTRDRLARGVVDGPIRRLLAHEIARTRELYRTASQGIRLLDPASRDCVRTALRLYAGILDAVEASGYDVLSRRVSVPLRTRLAVAGPGLVRAHRARR